jgi:hypothetical protein
MMQTGPPPAEAPIDERMLAMVESARRSDEMRNEARAVIHETLEEAMAPLSYAMRELERRFADMERRLTELEQRPAPRAAAPSAPNVVAAAAAAPVFAPAKRAPVDPYPPAAAAAPVRAPQATVPRAAVPVADIPISLGDIDVPFDGRKRQRRVVVFFTFLFILVFGGLLGTMIFSYVR